MSDAPTPDEGRCAGPGVQDYLDRDTRPVPSTLRHSANDVTGRDDIPVDRYLSADYARLEMERVWYRAWQFACLESELEAVGDIALYEIGTQSVVIVRSGPGRIQGFLNSCLHRGRRLREHAGHAPELRCPYHSFAWNLDGTFKGMPCPWDFPHVKAEDFCLPEVQVDTWRGFVFVNLDPGATPLADHLGGFTESWVWPIEQRYKAVHVARVIPVNWKTGQEAFMESYHVLGTHPQTLLWMGDANSQYDATSAEPHWNRMINPQAVPSPHVADQASEQAVLESFYESRTFYAADRGRDLQADGGHPAVPEGESARAVLAQAMRDQLAATSGDDYSAASDSEMLDAVQYFVFPNLHPWGGNKSNIVFRWRPDGLDPGSSIFDVIIMASWPQGQERPAPAAVVWVTGGMQYTDLPQLGLLGPVLDQDMDNLHQMRAGLASSRKGLTLGVYQESRLRHFHQALDAWMDRD